MKPGSVRPAPPDSQGRPRVYHACIRCGAVRMIRLRRYRNGLQKRCGSCNGTVNGKATGKATIKAAIKANTTHGESGRPEYRAWLYMRNRCYDVRNISYRNYGGRGIRVCERWRYSYPAFLADVGRRPSPQHSIDRIDNDGNYTPGNVRWATRIQQNRNKQRRRAE
jgi:hypothetical protein